MQKSFEVGDVGVERPREVLRGDDGTREADLETAVHHGADVVPAVAEAVVGVGLRNVHQHVGGLLVVELEVDVQAVPESEVQTEVGGPRGLPAQVFVALRGGGDAGRADIVGSSGDECEVLVVGNRRVTGRTGRDVDLCVGQPVGGILHETLVAQVPHEADRSEDAPAVRGAETRRGVGADGELGEVAVVVVVLAAAEERQQSVVVGRGVLPRGRIGSGPDVGQFVVVLTAGGHAERFVVVVRTVLTDHEVERVLVVHVEPVVDRVGYLERQGVGGVARCGALLEVGQVFGHRLSESGGVREIDAELRPDRQPLDGRRLGEERGKYLVFLVAHRIVLDPLEGVLAVTLPAAVLDRGERAVGAVGIPVGEHEPCGRDRRDDGVFARLGQFDVLVVEHRVRADLEPLGGPLFDIGADRVAVEGRAGGDTLLAVVAARDVVVRAVVGARNGQLVALEHGRIVEYGLEPVYVGLAQQVVVLAVGQSDLLFVLDALGGVHQVPVAVGDLRETELHAVVDDRMVVHAAALGGDDHHAVGRAGSVDRGRGGVLEYREVLDVGRVDHVEVRAGDHHAVEDEERFGARVDRVRTADGHDGRLAGLTRVGEYREARDLTLQRLVKCGRRGAFDLFGLDGRYRSGDGALLAHAVGDDDHILESLRVALHLEVEGHVCLSFGNDVLDRLVADVLEDECGAGGNLDGVASVGKGRNAGRRSGNHVHPDQGLFVFSRGDYATDGDGLPPPLTGLQKTAR